MIKSISVKQIATFDNDGTIIDNLKKVNFIYGANGCGKTTLSKKLAAHYNALWIEEYAREYR